MDNRIKQDKVETGIRLISELDHMVDAVYQHSAFLQDYSNKIKDYDGYLMTETEAHTLMYICDHPEITVTQLAQDMFRTKGSISKMLKKLVDKGLIEGMHKEGNMKWLYFVPTEEGIKVNAGHRSFDRNRTMNMISWLLNQGCTMEEIQGFYKVIDLRTKFMKEENKDLL